jgi:RNHCP domain
VSRDARQRSRHRAPGSFRCRNCGLDIDVSAPGTGHRNHCPNCLWSRHVDERPGDRAAECGSSMEPIAISVRGDGEWVLIHRCTRCDALHANRSAGDDNPLVLVRVAMRPIVQSPFPLERLTNMAGMGR